MAGRKSAYVLESEKSGFKPHLGKLVRQLYESVDGKWPEGSRSYFQEVKAGRQWPGDEWLNGFVEKCGQWFDRLTDEEKKRSDRAWVAVLLADASRGGGAKVIVERLRFQRSNEGLLLRIAEVAKDMQPAEVINLPTKSNVYYEDNLRLIQELRALPTKQPELEQLRIMRERSKTIFRKVIAQEIIDMTSKLTRRKCEFFATDTFLGTYDPQMLIADESLALLSAAYEQLANDDAFEIGRSWRTFIVPDIDSMLDDARQLDELHLVVNDNIARGLTVCIATAAAMHPNHICPMWNMYLISNSVVVFGAQPIPATARYSSDADGRHMVSMGRQFADHIKSEADRGAYACKFTEYQRYEEFLEKVSDLKSSH